MLAMDKRRALIDVIAAAILFLSGAVFFLTVSILVPTLFRPYYYLHVHMLDIPKSSGYDVATIHGAFNDVMDYIWLGAPFKTGTLPHSEEGAAHFADCVPLFWLNAIACLSSATLIIVYFVLWKAKAIRPKRLFRVTPLAYSGFFVVTMILTLGIWGLIDFDSLFVAFHSVFFPGKGNWVFSERTDPIIKILPEAFFACCGAYIASSALVLSLASIIVSFATKKKAASNARLNGQGQTD